MYAKRFGKRKAIRARRPYKRVPRKRSGGRQAITKIVKSVLSRQAENKIWIDYGVNQPISTAVSAVMTNRNLLPTLSNGTGVSTRIGNEVKVKSAYIRGHVNLLPYNASTNPLAPPLYVRMWVVSSRQINTTNLSATSIASNFFEIGAGSAGPQGNMLDIDFSPNKDAWIIHATKTVKIGAGYTAMGTVVTTGAYFDNSPMSVPFYFNYGKKLSTLKYDETITSPTNKNMFLVFQAVAADGSSGLTTYNQAEFHYTTRVEYEDM